MDFPSSIFFGLYFHCLMVRCQAQTYRDVQGGHT